MATTGTDSTDTERVMYIRFRRSETEQVEETLRALDADGNPEPYFECVFQDSDQLHQVTRPTNLRLLRTIATAAPESIRELARLTDRDVRQVHRNLNELETLGLIELEENGQSKQPSVWYDSITVDLPLLDPDTGSDTADV